MRKKVLATISAVSLAGALFSSMALAKSPNAKESLVALGDSITFGYNLGVNNEHPSKEAFPYLIDNDGKDFRVDDLGVPGWNSSQLLDALQNDSRFQQAVKHADTITLDIGSNDLLHGLAAGSTDPQAMPKAINTLLTNLFKSILEIRSLTDAPIVVYNFYNPFQLNNPLHRVGDTILPGVNFQIATLVNSFKDKTIVIADANTAYGQNQLIYVRQGDIHPTAQGQEVLADLAEEALGLK